MNEYNPEDWFWIVAGNGNQAWSSAAAAYVDTWLEDRLTRIASEAELNDVLAVYGMKGPLVTADHVRAEAQRRIVALTGTADIIGCLIKQHNAQMRATELTLIQAKGGTWTEAEAAEATALQGLADAIKAIREASNVLEAMNPIPADYADNSRWP